MALTPQQQAWLQAWEQHQAQLLAANQQNLLQAQPWHQPGYSRFANPLFGRSQIPLAGGTTEQESDPQAAMMPYFMGMMGTQPQGGEGVNPMLMQMLMSGSMGYQG